MIFLFFFFFAAGIFVFCGFFEKKNEKKINKMIYRSYYCLD